jgi:hypothetical protein
MRAVYANRCGAPRQGPWCCERMNVLALTILISTCLAGVFVICFAVECRRGRRSSTERDSLLPLNEDLVPAPVKPTTARR